MRPTVRCLATLGALAASLSNIACGAPSSPTATTRTFFSFTSSPDDVVGRGASPTYTLEDATFHPIVDRARGRLGVEVRVLTGGYWRVEMVAPGGRPLTPGTYDDAGFWPLNAPSQPGFYFAGNGRGCTPQSARFVVRDATYGTGDSVLEFHASFEQRCPDASAPLRGEVRIAADPWR
jgi:hypothetical protein